MYNHRCMGKVMENRQPKITNVSVVRLYLFI